MIRHNKVCLTDGDRAAVDRVLESGQIGQGPEIAAFEEELAARFRPGGAAACVSSGTAALRLAVSALENEDVILPTYACVSLYHAVNDGVGEIALVDCDDGTFNASDASVVVHTYGVPSDVPEDAIEDFTHAPGASIGDRACGSFGAASVISFGATKPLGCGVGGAVLGPVDLIEEVRDVRDYDGKRTLRERFNWQMDDMTAALGRSRLRRLDAEIAWRQVVAATYYNVCHRGGYEAIVLGQATPNVTPSWYRFVIQLGADELLDAQALFREAGIETIVPLEPWELIHRQLGLDGSAFPNAEALARTTLSLPIWPGMTDAEVRRVADVLAMVRETA